MENGDTVTSIYPANYGGAGKTFEGELFRINGNVATIQVRGCSLVDVDISSVKPFRKFTKPEHLAKWNKAGTINWKILTPGESTAFCPHCDVELELGTVYYTEANPLGTAGNIDLICPKCKEEF